MTVIGTKLFTLFRGHKVGADEFGNKYYTSAKNKRWVVYKGIDEASKVPAEWHRWLHKTTDEIPAAEATKQKWQKPHLPNLSGTKFAYVPKGHISRGAKRAQATGDYTAWKPE